MLDISVIHAIDMIGCHKPVACILAIDISRVLGVEAYGLSQKKNN